MNPNFNSLGFQPSGLIGTTSLLSMQQQFTTLTQMLTQYQPGAITNSNMGQISASNLQSSNITGQLIVGNGNNNKYIMLDGVNENIKGFDGTTNRILIGNN